jgi:uncharacterized protein (UPF0332 family)
MSLEALVARGRLQLQATSSGEIADLLIVAERGLKEAQATVIANDLRFSAAYDAALTLATVVLRCVGYRTRGVAHHATIFEALPSIMGEQSQARADLFEACRMKRNVTHYRRAGEVTLQEVEELLATAVAFRDDVREWVEAYYPQYSAHY